MSNINFNELPISKLTDYLSYSSPTHIKLEHTHFMFATSTSSVNDQKSVRELAKLWQDIQNKRRQSHDITKQSYRKDIEILEVDWLIKVFNQTFRPHNVVLTRGKNEPEYFPATQTQPARLEFAHGFFSSALHEISHWCIAGVQRRSLPDFGYWYATDGRSEAQQRAFERVEIKPQALECLFTLTCGKEFRASQDNLNANFDTSKSTFVIDVYHQAQIFIENPDFLPLNAKKLLTVLSHLCHDINKTIKQYDHSIMSE